MGNGWGGPQGRDNGGGDGPDWAAMADQHERETRRRRQLRVVGGTVAAVLLVGGVTATAVTVSGSSGGRNAAAGTATTGASARAALADDGSDPVVVGTAPGASAGPSASAAASAGAAASPSGTAGGRPSGRASAGASSAAPTDPLTRISSAATDTAPLDPAAMFADHLTVGGRVWTRLTTASTVPCWKATTGGLGDVLAPQGCRTMLRATYTSGSSAVTVGVAVLDSRAQADAAAAGYRGQVQGLVPSGHTSYCTGPGCANTHGSVGRYDYFTVAGTVKPGGNTADATAAAAQGDFAGYARGRLLARGQ
ncbi:hypothetical protein [Kitasatospora paranensis]|uniref:Uncharacterized protein n=1 Tax=Kitasatospora paranensis TaxID=258053 RepID=A0ABW2FY52_9ACTN